MPKLIDLDQHITVPITDDHGTYTVEITVGEFFKRFLPGEQLKVVDAVPVEWLCDNIRAESERGNILNAEYIKGLIWEWHQEEWETDHETD